MKSEGKSFLLLLFRDNPSFIPSITETDPAIRGNLIFGSRPARGGCPGRVQEGAGI